MWSVLTVTIASAQLALTSVYETDKATTKPAFPPLPTDPTSCILANATRYPSIQRHQVICTIQVPLTCQVDGQLRFHRPEHPLGPISTNAVNVPPRGPKSGSTAGDVAGVDMTRVGIVHGTSEWCQTTTSEGDYALSPFQKSRLPN
jgi:hypothetical protein